MEEKRALVDVPPRQQQELPPVPTAASTSPVVNNKREPAAPPANRKEVLVTNTVTVIDRQESGGDAEPAAAEPEDEEDVSYQIHHASLDCFILGLWSRDKTDSNPRFGWMRFDHKSQEAEAKWNLLNVQEHLFNNFTKQFCFKILVHCQLVLYCTSRLSESQAMTVFRFQSLGAMVTVLLLLVIFRATQKNTWVSQTPGTNTRKSRENCADVTRRTTRRTCASRCPPAKTQRKKYVP